MGWRRTDQMAFGRKVKQFCHAARGSTKYPPKYLSPWKLSPHADTPASSFRRRQTPPPSLVTPEACQIQPSVLLFSPKSPTRKSATSERFPKICGPSSSTARGLRRVGLWRARRRTRARLTPRLPLSSCGFSAKAGRIAGCFNLFWFCSAQKMKRTSEHFFFLLLQKKDPPDSPFLGFNLLP